MTSKIPHRLSANPWSNRLSKNHEKKTDFCSWIKTFCKGFGLLLTYEIIEELIEEAIAYTITTVIAKAVSFLLVVVLTQTVKVTAKGLAKGIVIVLKPLVKKFTYREGNDKINKILRFIDMCKEKVKENKFLNFLKRNPKSILGILAGFIASIASGAGTTCGLIVGKVEIPLWGNILLGVCVCVVEFVLIALGVKGAGFEGVARYQVRKIAERLGFGKTVDELEKVEKAVQEEEEAKAEAEKEAKEKAQEKYYEGWRKASKEQNYDGSLEEYIAVQEEIEKAKQAEIDKVQAEEKEKMNRVNWTKACDEQGYKGSFADWKAENIKE